MSLKRRFFIFTILCFWNALTVAAQNNESEDLKKLDSIAFASLENNASKVLMDAGNLLDASLKGKPSFYTVNAYTIFAIVNKNRGFYVTALDYSLKALNTSEKINDIARKSACLNNIGSVYQLQHEYEKAIDFFNQSLELEKKLNQPLQQSIRFYNLGECYKDIDKLDLALTYFNNSLIIEKKLKNNEGIIYAELGIADVYIQIERFSDAEMVLENIGLNITNNQFEEKIIFHKLKGQLFLKKGDNQLALIEFKEGENLSKKHNIRTHLIDLLRTQISIYEENENWKLAALKYKEFSELNDEMNSLRIKNQLDDLNYRNEIIKKQLELEYVQEERDLAKKNQEFEKDLRIYGQKITWFVILLLIFCLGLIFYGVKKLTSKRND
ncbi:MAG: tetratricopeptide repeat protein [Crocinitomicaceae bacterium]|jgi:two-component system, sensor histidine kinase PdtaS|nr:tetratricopeptide repeat protein [Crocinitomicaceae bacterium]MDP4867089.1 tetratricopeptide repeat protein [Crocinitomicaceae bacterium]MDP5009915.1 tetratricopeptide repeat protein [Crocinitomicaceae bacterium]